MNQLLTLALLLSGLLGLIAPHSIQAAEKSDLAARLAAARDGDTIEVDGGIHHGPLEINNSITLIGVNWPVIDGGGQGTVLHITAPDVHLEGFVIRNSGDSLDQENSGIAVEAAGTTIVNNRLEETLFGIYLRKAPNSVVADNSISSMDVDVPRRGDPIRVWYSNGVRIENNTIEKGRDVVLWYSEQLQVSGNTVTHGRYGLHFMYCDDAIVENNLLYRNSVGAFMMYSRRITLQNNTIAGNRGPSGYGVGLKDMDDALIENNLFLDNRVGAYLDNSPREVDSIGRFTGNVFGYNDIGVSLLPSVRHNEFVSNNFIENEEQVAIEGGGTMSDNTWSVAGVGNYWSDYAGFDANNDGFGDLPYRSERLFEQLVDNQPAMRIFLYSPAAAAVDFAARAFPLIRPQPKLVDEGPLMSPDIPAGAPPLPAEQNGRLWPLLLLVVMAVGLMSWPWLAPQSPISRRFPKYGKAKATL
ncbi:MAG: nitrous oxide reductase family maturation protein NosD [Ardenticatenaceae bacterium]|nr:nitrous oxide reductase family maturation protein NosD [Ardenticatenaceae bacterium]